MAATNFPRDDSLLRRGRLPAVPSAQQQSSMLQQSRQDREQARQQRAANHLARLQSVAPKAPTSSSRPSGDLSHGPLPTPPSQRRSATLGEPPKIPNLPSLPSARPEGWPAPYKNPPLPGRPRALDLWRPGPLTGGTPVAPIERGPNGPYGPPPAPPNGAGGDGGGGEGGRGRRRRRGRGRGGDEKVLDLENPADLGKVLGKSDGKVGKAGDVMSAAFGKGKDKNNAIGSLITDAVRETIGRAKEMKQGAKDIASGGFEAMKGEGIAGTGKGLMKSLEGFGKVLGPMGGKFVEKVAAMGNAVFETIDAYKKLNEALHESNMQFADFSAGMAQVAAQREIENVMLAQKRGERRADSAGMLSESQVELNRRMAVIEDYIANIKNYILGKLNNGLVKLIDLLTGDKLKDEGEGGALVTFRDMLMNREEVTERLFEPAPPARPRGL